VSGRVPTVARWIVALAAGLVPSGARERWRRQWEAELEHRAAAVGDGAVPSGDRAMAPESAGRRRGSGLGMVRFALGSIRHAIYLRREEATMRGILADVRHSARALLRQPGFALLTMATFAIGIGATTAIFSLAEALVLRPLPLEDSDRLVRIFSTQPRRGLGRFSVSYPDFVDFSERGDLFEAATLYREGSRDVSGGIEPVRVQVVSVHHDFFQTLGSPTRLGRVFTAGDHEPTAPRTAILSGSFWSGRLAADSAVVGRTIRLDGVSHTVVGVVSDRFGWPSTADVWTPLQWGDAVPQHVAERSNHSWQVVARLRDGVAPADASSQVGAMADAIYARDEVDPRDEGTSALVVPLHSSSAGDGAGALFATLGGAVFFVLLIASMNASGLLLVRAWSRARELSLRAALGAGRRRLVFIMLAESGILALAGGAVGVWLGVVGLDRAFAMAPPDITALGEPRLNAAVVAVGLGVSVLAALLAGAIPALRVSRISVSESLKEGSGKAGGGSSSTRLRKALVVAEVALSLALLTGAGLTIRGFQRQISTDPGFDASTLISFTVRLPEERYGDDALVDAYYREATERLERDHRIQAATAVSRLPLGAGGLSLGRAFIFDGAARPPEGATFPAAWIEVDPDYLATLGIGPVEGRWLGTEDRGDSELVAVVNQRMADLMSPDQPIAGRRIRSVYDEDLPRTVVGVIPDFQLRGVSRTPRQAVVLVPRNQSVRRAMAFLVRASGEPGELLPVVRSTLAEIDADVALDQLQPLRSAHAADLAGIRFLTTIFAAFGILALVLAAGGIYGLVSYSVSRRQREIGVRMAMGATAGGVRRSVLGESAVMAAVGLAVGLVLAYGAGRVLAVGMTGIAVLELSTYAAVALVLAVSVLVASWLPSIRATRIDPVEALRSE